MNSPGLSKQQDSEASRTQVQIPPPLLSLGLRASYSATLGLHFLLYTMGLEHRDEDSV